MVMEGGCNCSFLEEYKNCRWILGVEIHTEVGNYLEQVEMIGKGWGMEID